MQYVCDADGRRTWFRIETDAEAAAESELMRHAVEKHFRRAREAALRSYQPGAAAGSIERDIGLEPHVRRAMPLFLTLREADGAALATAMLPPLGRDDGTFRMILVGPANADPYPGHGEAIAALGRHFGLSLTRERCYPYQSHGV